MVNNNPTHIPVRPSGWPVGSFYTYAEAQAAVDQLSDEQFPVEKLTIVGVDLAQVEKVTGRLTWGKVLGGGALAGAWWGLFFGLLFSILSPQFWAPIVWGIVMGVIFGLIFAAVGYGLSGGDRDFTSMTQIVAGRYDLIAAPEVATQARDRIAQMGLGTQGDQQAPEVQPGAADNQAPSNYHPENDPQDPQNPPRE